MQEQRRTMPVGIAALLLLVAGVLCFSYGGDTLVAWLRSSRASPSSLRTGAEAPPRNAVAIPPSTPPSGKTNRLAEADGSRNRSASVLKSPLSRSDLPAAKALGSYGTESAHQNLLFKENSRLFRKPRVDEDNIFFVETTCALDRQPRQLNATESGLHLTARAACALESVASQNPHLRVFLVHTCTLNFDALLHGFVPTPALVVLSLPNVFLWPLRFAEAFTGTPLQQWLASGALARSKWPVSHASDALRYVLLWRYGGFYFDLDVVARRSLDGLRNFAGAESDSAVAIGAVGLARDALGRRVAAACLRELRDDFRGDDWGHNGPGVITRVLQRLCEVEQVADMTEERCGGFRVLPPSAFYPVPWREWRRYFEEQDAELTMAALKGSYAIHVWNKKSAAENASLTSQQPYAQVARRFCPHVVRSAGQYF